MLCAIAEGAQQYTLTVAKQGSGSGTVTSSPAGINCGSNCSVPYNQGTKITLKAKTDPGSTFTGWSGGCTGTSASCKLTMTSDQTVTATFALPDLRGELSNISLKLSKSTYQISGKLTVYSDGGKTTGVKANVYVSYEETLGNDALLLGSITMGNINAGSSVSKTFKFNGQTDPSGRYVIAVINPDDVIKESNYANNIAVSYYQGGAPQLEVTLDQASSVSGVIDHGEGITLETTSGGSNLSLTLLEHSLMSFPQISLTGVSGIKGLPQSMTMLAGAQLGPEGLSLLEPAALTIGLPPGAPTEGLIGFLSQDNGRRFQFYPIDVNGTTATFQMPHFTPVGVAGITCSDISALANPTWLEGEALAEYRIAIANAKFKLNCNHLDEDALMNAYEDEIAGILEDWYFGKGGILDQLMVVEDPEDLMPIISEFILWIKRTEIAGLQERALTKPQACGYSNGQVCSTFFDVEGGGWADIGSVIEYGVNAANTACLNGDSTKDSVALKWLLIAESLAEVSGSAMDLQTISNLWNLKTCGVYSLEVIPCSASINVVETTTLQAVVKDKAGKVVSGHSVVWWSDDKGIATVAAVDNNGINAQVSGVSVGSTFVVAALREEYFLHSYAYITVSSFATSLHYYMTTQPSCHAERMDKRVADPILLTVIGRDPRGSESTAGFSVAWSVWDAHGGGNTIWPAGFLSSSQGQAVFFTLGPPCSDVSGETGLQASVYDDASGTLLVRCPYIIIFCENYPGNYGGWCGGPVCCACNYTGPLQFTDNPVFDELPCHLDEWTPARPPGPSGRCFD